MAQLNDYCVVVMTALDRYPDYSPKIKNVNREAYDSENEYLEAAGDIWYVQQHIEPMEDTDLSEFYGPASCLVMLFFFLIKSLKSINRLENTYAYGQSTKQKDESEFHYLIDLLERRRNTKFRCQHHAETVQLMKNIRQIRNNFAHGEWDQVRRVISQINIVKAFYLVSEILMEIQEEFSKENSRKLNCYRQDGRISYFAEKRGEKFLFPKGTKREDLKYNERALKWELIK